MALVAPLISDDMFSPVAEHPDNIRHDAVAIVAAAAKDRILRASPKFFTPVIIKRYSMFSYQVKHSELSKSCHDCVTDLALHTIQSFPGMESVQSGFSETCSNND